MILLRSLAVEAAKLRGSLALLLIVTIPALLSAIIFLALVTNDRVPAWKSVTEDFTLTLWSFFLLPMAIAAYATLLGNVEHRSRAWEHWLSLPTPKWCYFASKAIMVVLGAWLMTVLAVVFTCLAAVAAGSITGRFPTGSFDWARLIWLVALINASAVLPAAIQLWTALRFSNFVVAIAVGIFGTLTAIAVTMTQTTQADYFPWVLPIKVMTSAHPLPAALFGLTAGLACLCVMIGLLQRSR